MRAVVPVVPGLEHDDENIITLAVSDVRGIPEAHQRREVDRRVTRGERGERGIERLSRTLPIPREGCIEKAGEVVLEVVPGFDVEDGVSDTRAVGAHGVEERRGPRSTVRDHRALEHIRSRAHRLVRGGEDTNAIERHFLGHAISIGIARRSLWTSSTLAPITKFRSPLLSKLIMTARVAERSREHGRGASTPASGCECASEHAPVSRTQTAAMGSARRMASSCETDTDCDALVGSRPGSDVGGDAFLRVHEPMHAEVHADVQGRHGR
ncbi:MAG: hypothetical protein J0L92_24875 [Deltaproteobacteria bacterium]|nr:hypothetical protein [Deltaproteobacteria bacterium]